MHFNVYNGREIFFCRHFIWYLKSKFASKYKPRNFTAGIGSVLRIQLSLVIRLGSFSFWLLKFKKMFTFSQSIDDSFILKNITLVFWGFKLNLLALNQSQIILSSVLSLTIKSCTFFPEIKISSIWRIQDFNNNCVWPLDQRLPEHKSLMLYRIGTYKELFNK